MKLPAWWRSALPSCTPSGGCVIVRDVAVDVPCDLSLPPRSWEPMISPAEGYTEWPSVLERLLPGSRMHYYLPRRFQQAELLVVEVVGLLVHEATGFNLALRHAVARIDRRPVAHGARCGYLSCAEHAWRALVRLHSPQGGVRLSRRRVAHMTRGACNRPYPRRLKGPRKETACFQLLFRHGTVWGGKADFNSSTLEMG